MTVESIVYSENNEEKLETLKNHYRALHDFFKKLAEIWNKYCLKYNRHVFFFPYRLCQQIENLCSQMIVLFDESSPDLKEQIADLCKKIIEIQEKYKIQGYTADVCLKSGGFSLENLKRLYFKWEENFDRNTDTNLSHSYSKARLSENLHHKCFMDLFYIEEHFLDSRFRNTHQTEYSETVKTPLQARSDRFNRAMDIDRNGIPTWNDISEQSFENKPYIEIEEGQFDAFDDFIRYEHTTTLLVNHSTDL